MRRTADTAAQRSTGVSFIVPVYNKAPWLPRVLDQIAAQRGNFEREYIFVDDGSTDGSVQILRERTAEWPGVTIIEQANHGPAHATNRGIERAKMPFIKFCDADDLLADDATVTLLRALLEHPDAVLAFGEAEIYDDGWKIDLTTDLRYATATTIHSPVAFALRNNPYIPAQVLMRSELVCASGGCDERLPYAQDYTLSLRMARRGPFLRVDVPVAFIARNVPGRLSEDSNREKRDSNLACALFLRENPQLTWRLKQFACRRAAGRARRCVVRHGGNGRLRATALYLRSRFPIIRGHAAFIERCTRVIPLAAAE